VNPVDKVELDFFLSELLRLGAVAKDADADDAIRRAFERQPDAPYLVTQRVFQLEDALRSARAKIAGLIRSQTVPKSSGTIAPHPPAPRADRISDAWWRRRSPSIGSTAFFLESIACLLGERDNAGSVRVP